ncbi:MAG: ASCH domain-containing protein [Alphaproteobacteria bacterium]|nr:ASCH domain-containing protein [Alphaproteobacteria bacterium]
MHKLNVQEKYYNLLKSGAKTIELRLYDEKRQAIRIGDTIEFSNLSDTTDTFKANVINLHKAESFAALCDKIDPRRAGMADKAELLKVLSEFYPEERQKAYGVVGIEIKRI